MLQARPYPELVGQSVGGKPLALTISVPGEKLTAASDVDLLVEFDGRPDCFIYPGPSITLREFSVLRKWKRALCRQSFLSICCQKNRKNGA